MANSLEKRFDVLVGDMQAMVGALTVRCLSYLAEICGLLDLNSNAGYCLA